MRHKVRDTFKHTARLENKCREGHFGEVHAYSGNERAMRVGGPRVGQDEPKLGYQGGDDGTLVLISVLIVSVRVAHERWGGGMEEERVQG